MVDSGFQPLFGDGFHQRAMEAVKCRNAEAWLACCAMVGAAAESVLLAIAITKEGDEERVLRVYRSNRGRQAVLNMIVGQADAQRRNTRTTFAGIVSLWRDDAAHGQASPIDTSMRMKPCVSSSTCASGSLASGITLRLSS